MRCVAVVAAVFLALSASVAAGADGLQRWTGGPPPPLRLTTLAGQELTLASFRGRTVIVNFWATWCEPCLAEMPSLQRLRDKLALQGVEVVAVNLKENAARISPFVERLGLTFPVVRDSDGAATKAWRVNVFPTSFIIGPDQRIAFVVRGGVEWDSARVESEVRRVNRTARQPGVHQAAIFAVPPRGVPSGSRAPAPERTAFLHAAGGLRCARYRTDRARSVA